MKPGDVNFEWNENVLTALGLCRSALACSIDAMWRLGKVCIQPSLPIKWQWHRCNGNKDLPDTLGKAMSWARIRKGKTGSEINARFVDFFTPDPKSVTLFQTVFWWTTETKMLEIAISQQLFVFWTKCTSTIATDNLEGCLCRAYDATFNVFLHSYKINKFSRFGSYKKNLDSTMQFRSIKHAGKRKESSHLRSTMQLGSICSNYRYRNMCASARNP